MKLSFLPRFRKQPVISYFLVLVLRQDKVNAVIFEEIEDKVKVIGKQQVYFSESIEDASLDEFLKVLDTAISGAESALPENIQTQKTVFGIKEEWAHNNQIKKEYLIKLKRACEELELTPIGFLVISQAIAHFLQKEEGAPLSAILTEVNKKSVTVTLIKGGKIIETKSSEIHDSVPFTVDTLLKHFRASEILPSRIITFNGKDDLSQEFIGHSFSKSLPFLHLPQISDLPEGSDARAVLFGAATQMGFEVLEKDISYEEQPKEERETAENEGQETREEAQEPRESTSDESFGFVRDKDVAKTQEKKQLERSQSKMGQDVLLEVPATQEKLGNEARPQKDKILLKTRSFFIEIIKAIRKIKIRIRMTILAPVALFLIAALSYFLFIHATITITVEPKIAEHRKQVTFSISSRSEPNKNILKGEFVTISEDGEISTQPTGKKDVGTKAKGEVTVFNSLSESKTLSAGSIIKSPNNLEFTLDQSLTIKGIASHSADETVSPEKATVNITSQNLGKEYNLPSGTKFSIASFSISDLVAKNDNPFSGGTKKEITVVSAKDIDKLEEDLPKQLEKKAQEDLGKKLDKKKILLPVFITSSLTKKTMDAKIGDGVNKLTLKGSVEYKGISYNKNDLIVFSKPLLEKALPADQKIDFNNIRASVKDVKQENDGQINATLIIKALLLPKMDEQKLRKEIKGDSFTKTEDLLYKISQVSNVDIVLSPNIPFLPKKLPIFENNIKIIMKIEDG